MAFNYDGFMDRLEAKEPSLIARVPTDVWRHVCDYLTTKEWMMHHWMDAHAIEVTMNPISDHILAAAHLLNRIGAQAQIVAAGYSSRTLSLWRLLHGARAKCSAPAALRVFRGSFISHQKVHKAMMGTDCQDTDGPWPQDILKGPLERFCACLLPLMGRLTALNLTIPRVPRLPPFRELKHLELHSIQFDGLQDSFSGIHKLETLFLSCEHLEATLPKLHLKGLPKLRHVHLDDVFPAELSLPPGCRLDLKGEADVMDKVIGSAWENALQHRHACTCRWTVTTKTPPESVKVETLPNFLSWAAGSIQELSLVGTRELLSLRTSKFAIRLDREIFCNLKRLWMKSDGQIQIYIPAAVHLASLQIYADVLGLSFENATVSCANLKDVTVLCRATKLPSVVELLRSPLAKNASETVKASVHTLGTVSTQVSVASGYRKRYKAARSVLCSAEDSSLITQQSSALQAMSSAPSAQSLDQMTPTDGAHSQATSERIPSLRAELANTFSTALSKAFPSVDIKPAVTAANNPDHGDYQCNCAMALFGRMKGKEGALEGSSEVAAAILDALPDTPAIDIKPALACSGSSTFINIKFSSPWLSHRIQDMITQGVGTWAPKLPYKRAVVDFSSPNVAKEMHVGHLRSTIIGDTIARTLEFCGVDTLRINHVGDWGTQFGMLIQHIAETRLGGLQGTATEDVSDLQALYKASKDRFDKEEDFKARARQAVTRLQSGASEFLQTWKRICEASRNAYDAIYQRLDVRLVWRGESFYNPRLAPLVEELIERGIAEDSEGAKVIHVEGQKVPLMIRKADGGYGYGTTDMAALHQRIHEEKAEWLIYVTDEGQAGHFKLVFGAAKRASIIPADNPPRIDHVGFGLVLGPDGKRIRSRDGGAAVRLVELLDEAKERCAASVSAVEKKRQESTIKWGGEEISEEELDNISSIMGYGAVKYADLKNNRSTNYKFNVDEMLDLKGNTAVYMLYAHARIAGIIRKSNKDVIDVAQNAQLSLDHPSERVLAVHIVRFTEMVEDMLVEMAPNRITEYVYELSNHFNTFYQACKVLGEAEEDSRLLLCEATAMIMRQCFQLLGIQPLYRI